MIRRLVSALGVTFLAVLATGVLVRPSTATAATTFFEFGEAHGNLTAGTASGGSTLTLGGGLGFFGGPLASGSISGHLDNVVTLGSCKPFTGFVKLSGSTTILGIPVSGHYDITLSGTDCPVMSIAATRTLNGSFSAQGSGGIFTNHGGTFVITLFGIGSADVWMLFYNQ